ncbi:MAG: tetratricopeptide repeat protein, partial [Gemmataceae bacterium]|nr:tetratricopeptide repeat protein [Gemmataceae bacterium]
RLIREQEAPTPSSRLSSAESMPSAAASRQTEPAKLGRFVKGELDWIVLKALSKDRDRRYESANGFARDIERFLNHEPVTAGPPSTRYRMRKFVQRNRGQVIAASLVLLALVAGVIGTTVGLIEAKKQEARAVAAADEERKAKQQAEDERANALKAAEAERVAKLDADARREEAVRNLAFAKKGNELLGSVFAGLDPNKIAESARPLQDVLRDNLLTAVKELEGSAIGDPLEVAAMQKTLGVSLLGLGDSNLAIEVLEKARATCAAKLGPDHPDTLGAMDNLAVGYQDAGRLMEALPLFEETLRLRKAKLGPDHPDTLNTMNNLAVGYKAAGRLMEALPLYEETLRLIKSNLGPDHPDTLNTMNNLAVGYKAAGRLDHALPLYEETLRLRKAKLGPGHPEILRSMNNLAVGYQTAGRLKEALPLFEETLRLRKAKLGPGHPETLRSMNNLAVGYQTAGRLKEALPLFEETLRLRKAKLGPDHPDTLGAMNNLAVGYKAAGRLDQALPLYEETLRLRKAKLGPDHPDTLGTMNNLAVGYQDAGRLMEALPLFEETLRLRKAKLGPDHPDTRSPESNRTFVRRLLDSPERYQHAREVRGEKHRDTLLALRDVGQLNIATGQTDQAESQLVEVLAGLSTTGPEDPVRAFTVGLVQSCLAIREKTQPDAWATFNTQSMLGEALLSQKKYVDAEPLLLKGYEGMKAREKTIPPQGSPRIPEALDRLVKLYTATNKPDELKKYQQLRANYPTPKEVAPMPKEK